MIILYDDNGLINLFKKKKKYNAIATRTHLEILI